MRCRHGAISVGIKAHVAEEKQPKRQVVQAQRFADSLTYNAYTALSRARQLRRDAEAVKEMLKKESEEDAPPIRDWFGFAVVSYYIVGFVTCLEWHARTRMADLFTYRPEAIDKNDIANKVPAEVLAQMIRAGVTVPHLLSASFIVGNVEEYLAPLQRIFDALGIGKKVAVVIQPRQTQTHDIFGEPYTEPTTHQRLSRLFESRHALVHEIGLMRMSSPGISDNWSATQVIAMGRLVEATIEAFENALREHGPSDFPNLLNEHMYPIDERAHLSAKVDAVSQRITRAIGQIRESRGIDEADPWQSVIASQDDFAAFIATSDLFQARYTDPRRALLRLELEGRLKLLEAIASAIGNPGINEDE